MSKRFVAVLAVIAVAGLTAGAVVATGQGSADDTLFATLNGRQEPGGGDNNGKGAASVVVDGRTVCVSWAVSDLVRIVGAHIHKAPRGQNGDIVVDPKAANGQNGSHATLGGCATVSRALARDIKRHPAQYYVNVHTTAFPGGAIRGQLHQ
jgi:CHRD domain